ncbi:MAG: DUF3280 domain-containing protein [Stellaceae bacterium]
MHRRAAGIVFAAALLAVACPAAARAGVPTVAFFGFDLVNTSLQPTTPAETARLGMLDDMLRRRLDASRRFAIAPIPPALRQRVAAGPAISGCNGCERDYAKAAGADWAAWGVVQKVSNLILNINLYMEDTATGKMEFVKSVDIRGNSDESWRHGLDYLLRRYLFREP